MGERFPSSKISGSALLAPIAPRPKLVKRYKNNGFLIPGSKNTIKLVVSATLVGGQRKKHYKTNGFCIAPQQQVLKRYKNQ